jgi:hypothetical protein
MSQKSSATQPGRSVSGVLTPDKFEPSDLPSAPEKVGFQFPPLRHFLFPPQSPLALRPR